MGVQAQVLQSSYQSFFYLLFVFQDIAWLAVQLVADSLERRKAHSPTLARLQNREVGWRYANALRQLRERHSATCQNRIEFNFYSHLRTVLRSNHEGSDIFHLFQILRTTQIVLQNVTKVVFADTKLLFRAKITTFAPNKQP